jgi:hypothetical protein
VAAAENSIHGGANKLKSAHRMSADAKIKLVAYYMDELNSDT